MVVDGKPLGKPDAGHMWHTEMSYAKPQGYVNVLYAVVVPHRAGKPLGATEFINARAAYDDLSAEMKRRLAGLTATHDVQNYWDRARAGGSARPAFTPEHRLAKPLVTHPLVMKHPVDGHEFLYCNSGFTVRVNELPEDESEALLNLLFEHQLRPQYRYLHDWTVNDLLIWDNFGTQHRAVADYGPDEHRLIKRCQVRSDKILDPQFIARVAPPQPRAAAAQALSAP
jgi:taurine dioxygenase